MRIKHFTDTDFDGLGCGVLSRLAYGFDVDVEFANPSTINKKVIKFVETEDLDEWDLILITDLSITEETLAVVKANKIAPFGKLKVIDHHKTALWLNGTGYGEVAVEKDGKLACGTSLTFDFFKQQLLDSRNIKSIIKFVEHVRLYDTWDWKKERTRTPVKINKFVHAIGLEESLERIHIRLANGKTSLNIGDFKLAEQLEVMDERVINEKIGEVVLSVMGDKKAQKDYKVGVIFSEVLRSELGNRMCEELDIDIAMIVDVSRKSVSMRTTREDIDLSELADAYGGGGHRKASGFPLTMELIKSFYHIVTMQK